MRHDDGDTASAAEPAKLRRLVVRGTGADLLNKIRIELLAGIVDHLRPVRRAVVVGRQDIRVVINKQDT